MLPSAMMLEKSFTRYLASAALALAAFAATVPPAAETLFADVTPANFSLFDFEAVQLTENIVAAIRGNAGFAEYASHFEFEDTSNSTLPVRARRARNAHRCKTMPGDELYPSKAVWDVFNVLLGGALQKIVPIGSPCYKNSGYSNYDAAKCADLVRNFDVEEIYYTDNGALMNPLYYGMTCPIPTSGDSATGTCTQGGYSEYAVKVNNVAQIQLAVNLARNLNLRLVVRNTGHDYNGRSVGKGALSIWTHGLKDIKYAEDYESLTYKGPVFKLGAGVQGFELYQAADKYGVSAIAGICPTVGVAGGYSAGGGHSPLMQLFGVGSDQIVALEVVLASGRFITVTPQVNSDLYWAMLGGGGGTFGVVTSVIVKVHRKVPVTTSAWTVTTSETVTADKFWEAFRFFYDNIPMYNRAKTYSYFSLMKLAPGTYMWSMAPFFATDKTVEEYEALIKPFYDKCASLGIELNANTSHYDSFYPAYQATFGTLNYYIGGAGAIPANRLVTSDNWETPGIRDLTFAAVQQAVDNAMMVNMYHQRPADLGNESVNSVNPAFRTEEAQIVMISSVKEQTAAGWKAASEVLKTQIMAPLRKVTPTGGAYGNEADIAEPNWQQAFWGPNYARLRQTKSKYNASMLFYVHHGVGTEGWMISDQGIHLFPQAKVLRASPLPQSKTGSRGASPSPMLASDAEEERFDATAKRRARPSASMPAIAIDECEPFPNFSSPSSPVPSLWLGTTRASSPDSAGPGSTLPPHSQHTASYPPPSSSSRSIASSTDMHTAPSWEFMAGTNPSQLYPNSRDHSRKTSTSSQSQGSCDQAMSPIPEVEDDILPLAPAPRLPRQGIFAARHTESPGPASSRSSFTDRSRALATTPLPSRFEAETLTTEFVQHLEALDYRAYSISPALFSRFCEAVYPNPQRPVAMEASASMSMARFHVFLAMAVAMKVRIKDAPENTNALLDTCYELAMQQTASSTFWQESGGMEAAQLLALFASLRKPQAEEPRSLSHSFSW
ncbi:Restculine oxidase [Pyrenophora seminiperda CCB06]|uniref:Restculine oxidase n=1 Tax=Pyrenophora seminiperda CCB06 TaxID=1302712 RepID=A0A3M7MDT5_9PLEO|nr:Restculine oxidase [Pyrenophora seminiperda CCB06]